ncbi:hypothetical protein [Mesorhizobium sp. IMUNJ 23232]|uniref:hypothetical protein n=1 Tax=Mesorhizobium sp. IMUNJ 23232 TaxID=3376064 RepID=UPI0037921A25
MDDQISRADATHTRCDPRLGCASDINAHGLLGALLSLAPPPLYGSSDFTCFGVVMNAGHDQQPGGVVTLRVGAAVYLFGGLVLATRMRGDPLMYDTKP